MTHHVFDEPVKILVGLGLPRSIESVSQAYVFLHDWPASRRGPAHCAALNACKAALANDIEPETARGAFAGFAARVGILAPDVEELVAASYGAAAAAKHF